MTGLNVADPVAALCAYLAHSVGDRLAQGPLGPQVFATQLPPGQDQNMPQPCLLVRRAGGYKMFNLGNLPLADPTLDIVCYGTVPLEGDQIATAVALALKQLTQSVWENTLLYWARIAGGPVPLPDTQTLWPATWLAAQVAHAEIAGQPA